MEIKKVQNILGSLGFGKKNTVVGNTFRWSQKGGYAGAQKVLKVITAAKSMGYTYVESMFDVGQSGPETVGNVLSNDQGVQIETYVRYGVAKESNEFTVCVRFPSIEV